MQSLGLAQEDVGLAMNMLKMQSQQCMTSEGLSGTVRPKNGVAQGSAESPMLFAMLLEPLIRTLEQKYSHLGFKMGGTSIVIQCYADDMVVLSESAEGLQKLLNVLETTANTVALRSMWAKTSLQRCISTHQAAPRRSASRTDMAQARDSCSLTWGLEATATSASGCPKMVTGGTK